MWWLLGSVLSAVSALAGVCVRGQSKGRRTSWRTMTRWPPVNQYVVRVFVPDFWSVLVSELPMASKSN